MFPVTFPTILPIKYGAVTLPPMAADELTINVLTVAEEFTFKILLTCKLPCTPTPPTVVREPVDGEIESILPFIDKFESIDALPYIRVPPCSFAMVYIMFLIFI